MGTKGPAGLRLSERAETKGGGEERFMGLVGGSGSRAKDGGGGGGRGGRSQASRYCLFWVSPWRRTMCGPLSQPARKRARRLIEWGRRMPPLDGCSEAPSKKRLGEQKIGFPCSLGRVATGEERSQGPSVH